MGAVAGLVLAAGGGSRLGRPKALLRLGDETLAERAVRVLREGGCEPVVVVAGAARVDVPAATTVMNPLWRSGIASSLKTGLNALSEVDAAVVILVDMPAITAEAVRRLVNHASPDALAMATYAGKRGHPVLLGVEHWAGVAELAHDDVGAKPYLARHSVVDVDCSDVGDNVDIDTREEAFRWGVTV